MLWFNLLIYVDLPSQVGFVFMRIAFKGEISSVWFNQFVWYKYVKECRKSEKQFLRFNNTSHCIVVYMYSKRDIYMLARPF